MDKQLKDVFNGDLQFAISCVPNRSSVPLNRLMNLEQFEHCSARVPIQPRAQQNSYEQNLSIEHEFQSPNYACSDSLTWTDETKVTSSIRAFERHTTGKKESNKKEPKKVLLMKSDEI